MSYPPLISMTHSTPITLTIPHFSLSIFEFQVSNPNHTKTLSSSYFSPPSLCSYYFVWVNLPFLFGVFWLCYLNRIKSYHIYTFSQLKTWLSWVYKLNKRGLHRLLKNSMFFFGWFLFPTLWRKTMNVPIGWLNMRLTTLTLWISPLPQLDSILFADSSEIFRQQVA